MTNYLQTVDTLQIELSNVCNAECLGCLRNSSEFQINRQHFGNFYLKKETLINILMSQSGKHLKELEFCGTLDEPLAHPQFLYMLQSILEINADLKISIHTNGSLRNKKYYKQLAQILTKFKSHSVRFSIDGLKKSVYVYRGIQNYDDIITNARSFIDNGGTAIWQMLSFPWNHREIDECESMAKRMGFSNFVLRRDRTSASEQQVEDILEDRVKNRTFPKYKPLVITDQILQTYTHELSEQYKLTRNNIDCHFQKNKKMFLDHKGRIWPCCFLANVQARNKGSQVEHELKINKKYGEFFNDLNHYTFDEILNHEWFTKDLTQSWKKSFELDSGCLSTCIKQCSKKSTMPIGDHLNMVEIQNKSNVYFGGCSYTLGDELIDRKASRFSKLVSEGIEYNEINDARGGASNKRIARKFVESVNKGKIDLAVFMWSNLARFEFWDNTQAEDLNPIMDGYQRYTPTMLNSKHKILKHWLTYYYTPEQQVMEWLDNMLTVQTICKSANIPYVMTLFQSSSTSGVLHKILKEKKQKKCNAYTLIKNKYDLIDWSESVWLKNKDFSFDSFTKENNYSIGPDLHPLEDAHSHFAKILQQHIEEYKLISK